MSSSRSRKNRICAACVAGCVLLGLPGSAVSSTPTAQSQLQEVDELALENNEAIHAFDSRAEQFRREAEFQQMRWPQPRVEYMGDVSAPWGPHFTTGHMVQVMQQIPRGGARQARAAPARAEAEVSRWEQREAKADLLRDLRLDVVELARIEAQLELLEDEIGLIDDAIGIVEAIAPFDEMGDYGDFYQLELARERAGDRQAALESARGARRARMASRMGVSVQTVEQMEFPPQLLEAWHIEPPRRDELVEMAREGDPQLGRLDARAEVADAHIERVDERTRPWPALMAGYSNMPPMWEMDGPRDQMVQLGISIPLPIFRNQYDVEASQFQQARQAVEQDRTQVSNEIRGSVEQLIAELETDEQRLMRHRRELLPLATDLADQVLVGIEVGDRSASDFLMALRQEIEVEAQLIELRADQLERLMELQRLTGGELGSDQPWAYPEVYGGRR